MTGRTHDAAALAGLGLVLLIDQPTGTTLATFLLALLANQVGGIAPDIDQPTAPLWRNLPVGKFVGRITGILLGGHRFISHSIIGIIIFGVAAHWLLLFLDPIMPSIDTGLVWWAFMIGYVSHLLMDSVTKEGVPWLLPIPIKFGFPPLKRLRITTGGKLEGLVLFPLLVGFVIWFCANHYAELQMLIRR